MRTQGARDVAAATLAALGARELERIWVHFDVDVVDPTLLPAVDTPTPGGIDLAALSELLAALVAAPQIAGLEVTIFDPDLDPDGAQAARLVDAIHDGLRAFAS